MNDDLNIQALQSPTLQNRHLVGLGLSTRQVHVWCAQIGIGGIDRTEGRWRGFSPLEALAFNVVWELKSRTDVALSKQTSLFRFLKDSCQFGAPVLDIWSRGLQPVLSTDLANVHSLLKASEEDGFHLPLPSPLTALLDITPSIERVIAGVTAGGTEQQKALVQRLIGRREAFTAPAPKIGETKTVRTTPFGAPQERIINLEIDNAKGLDT